MPVSPFDFPRTRPDPSRAVILICTLTGLALTLASLVIAPATTGML